RSPTLNQTHDVASRRRPLLGLPVQIVEQVGRHHVAERHLTLGEEPPEVQQVIRVTPDGSGREASDFQVSEESIRHNGERAIAIETMAESDGDHGKLHGWLPPQVEYPPRPAAHRGWSGCQSKPRL